jgi:hypothetical protein
MKGWERGKAGNHFQAGRRTYGDIFKVVEGSPKKPLVIW